MHATHDDGRTVDDLQPQSEGEMRQLHEHLQNLIHRVENADTDTAEDWRQPYLVNTWRDLGDRLQNYLNENKELDLVQSTTNPN